MPFFRVDQSFYKSYQVASRGMIHNVVDSVVYGVNVVPL